jgi:hypothetical protein
MPPLLNLKEYKRLKNEVTDFNFLIMHWSGKSNIPLKSVVRKLHMFLAIETSF